jgi:hypothetical protein
MWRARAWRDVALRCHCSSVAGEERIGSPLPPPPPLLSPVQDLPVDTRRVALAINYAMHLALKKGVQSVQVRA